MQFEGKIVEVMPLQQGTSASSGQNWSNREFVVVDDSGDYDETVVCRLRGEKAEQFSFRAGERVRVWFGFRAQKTKDGSRWFNEVRCFKIEKV